MRVTGQRFCAGISKKDGAIVVAPILERPFNQCGRNIKAFVHYCQRRKWKVEIWMKDWNGPLPKTQD